MNEKSRLTVLHFTKKNITGGRANIIQTMNDSFGMAQAGADVHLFIGKVGEVDLDERLNWFGLDAHPNLHIHIVKGVVKGDGWFTDTNRLFKRYKEIRNTIGRPGRTVIFSGTVRICDKILRMKRLLPYPVCFEFHYVPASLMPGGDGSSIEGDEEIYRRVFRGIDAAVVNAEPALEAVRYNLGDDRPAIVLPNGGRPIERSPDADLSDEILYLGSLQPDRGSDDLVRAMGYLPDVRLRMVGGDGEDLAHHRRIAREVKAADRISFEGFVPPKDTPKFLAGCALGVLPLRESHNNSVFSNSMKLLDYLCAGAPVVATDLPTHHWLESDECIEWAPPGNPAGLADTIKRCLADRGRLSRMAKVARTVGRSLTWEARGKRLVDYLDGLLG